MASTWSVRASPMISNPHPESNLPRRKVAAPIKKKKQAFGVFAARREAHGPGQNYGGRLVDESMIVLRRRIREMKVVERNYEPPSDWMDWEKEYFAKWDSLVCDMVGVLQTQLMNTRPGLALGVMALVTLSVPISTVAVFSHLVELTKMVLGATQLVS